MAILLDILYVAFLTIVSPVILYRMIRFGKYREGFAEKFLGNVPRMARDVSSVATPRRRLWFHAVSVGEVNLLKPILAQIARSHPDWETAVSTTSKTGHDLARKLFPDKTVFYCPLDFSWAVRRAIRRIRPDLLVLVELELWPNLINAAHRAGVKTAIVNGRISDGSFKNYNRARFLLRPIFRRLDLIAASDDQAADYFRRLGADSDRLVMTGSIKFDGVRTDRNNPKTRELANLVGIWLGGDLSDEGGSQAAIETVVEKDADIRNGGSTPDKMTNVVSGSVAPDFIFLAGSTQDPEEEMALRTFRTLAADYSNLKLILVPRHPERFEAVARLLDDSGLKWTRRSKLGSSPAFAETRILLVDTIGELGAWWGTASAAFVGGSMGRRGGQNMLEPAGYGAAVSFGPNTKNFRDISERMIREDAAVVVHNGEEMTAFVRRSLADPDWRKRMGENAQSLVKMQSGACRETVQKLEALS